MLVRPRCWCVAAALLAALGCATSSRPSAPLPAPAISQTLRPGDAVRLRIWREPDLSGDFPIDENGVAVLPKLGSQRVIDQSPDSLRTRLTAAYESFLRNPSIEVVPLRRVQILGAVRNPGLYSTDATMTLSDAIALAGGVAPQGKPDDVQLVRDGVRVMSKISRATRIAEMPLQSGDQLYVPERSWVTRNAGVVSAAITATVSLIIAFSKR